MIVVIFPNVKWKTEPIHSLNLSTTKFSIQRLYGEREKMEAQDMKTMKKNFAICHQTDLGPRSNWRMSYFIWFAWKFSASDTAISAHRLYIVDVDSNDEVSQVLQIKSPYIHLNHHHQTISERFHYSISFAQINDGEKNCFTENC